jgi:hypothetical protein
MSIDWYEAEREAAYDAFVAELYEEHKLQAIDEFVADRLRSYYLANPDVTVPALQMYKEGQTVADFSPTAAVICYASATELATKTALLKPLVYGLVHSESLAALVAELTVRQVGIDRFKNLLLGILKEYGGIDLDKFHIEGHTKTLWEEMRHVQDVRNAIIHRGAFPTPEESRLAKEVTTMIIGTFLARVIDSLGLKLVRGGSIASK